MVEEIDDLGKAVYGVFCFFSIYQRPLVAEEIFCFLLGRKVNVDFNELEKFLIEGEAFSQRENLFCLRGEEECFGIYLSRRDLRERFWRRVEKYVKWLRVMPFVRVVAVGNTLAFGAVDEESDIDLFIVATKGRLFFVRIFVTLFFQILGVRRHGKEVRARFCLSFYVSEEALNLSKIVLSPEDVYLYFWIVTLEPVLGLGVYRKFLAVNDWISKYRSENVYEKNSKLIVGESSLLQKMLEVFSNLFLIWWLEFLLKTWQMRRAKRKYEALDSMGVNVVVSENMLKFHNLDARERVQKIWTKKMRAFLGF